MSPLDFVIHSCEEGPGSTFMDVIFRKKVFELNCHVLSSLRCVFREYNNGGLLPSHLANHLSQNITNIL